MPTFTRSTVGAAAAVLALAAIPGAIVAIATPAAAEADVCANVGRRISVGGCFDIAGAIAQYAPPPGYYAPLPQDFTPNVSGCASVGGPRVSVGGCT